MAGKNPRAEKELDIIRLTLLSVLVGIVAGFGAVVFRGLIAFFHNLFFLGKFSFIYDANIFTPLGPWGPFIILAPVIGAFGVAYLVKNFAPEAEGHGVPEVIDAIHYNKGKIRPIVALVKSMASALSIGTGGSIGREGPIIQIGSSFGSTISQFLNLCTWQRIAMIAAGAGGGIAATFNTPVGGILFAVEIMMNEVSIRTLVPVAISTEVATYIGRWIFGTHPSFVVPQLEITYFNLLNPWLLTTYVMLGIFVGMISAVYIKSIYAFEDFFKRRINGSYYRRHMLGMLIVGIMMYFMMKTFGHYYIEGVGYATVQSVLSSNLTILYLLLLLFVLKLLAVSLTLGSGASGGIFSPGLFMGATFGGAYGIAMHTIFPGIGINAPAFAVAAMAGMIGGSTGAALTSVVMIFEMTLDYNVIIPMTLTVAIAYGVRTLFEKDTIYTKKLTRRGHLAPTGLRVNFQHMIRAKELMIGNVGFVDASTELGEFTKMTEANIHYPFYLIKDSANNVVSFIRDDMFDSIEEADSNKTIRDVGISHFIVVSENHLLSDIIAELRSNRASVALVSTAKNRTSASDILGVITEQRILEAIDNVNEMFSGSLR